MVLFTLLFAPGMVPMYVVVKELGLLDSYWSLILPVLINAFNLVVLRAFFMDIPEELYQAARIDGAGDWRILTRIVLPLSKGVVAVVGLFYAVTYWNAFFNAMLVPQRLRQVAHPAGPAHLCRAGQVDRRATSSATPHAARSSRCPWPSS